MQEKILIQKIFTVVKIIKQHSFSIIIPGLPNLATEGHIHVLKTP